MKILLAYDGGEPAERALTAAAKIVKAMGGTIDVVSVIPFHPGRTPVDPWDDRAVHDTELREARERLAGLGIDCQVIEPSGDPAVEIERTAKTGDYDMVVVGSRGLGSVSRFLQGSVSEHVATHAETAVLVAR